MTDENLAADVRSAVAALNAILAEAAGAGLAVTLHTPRHQTSAAGFEQVVVDVEIFKRL